MKVSEEDLGWSTWKRVKTYTHKGIGHCGNVKLILLNLFPVWIRNDDQQVQNKCSIGRTRLVSPYIGMKNGCQHLQMMYYSLNLEAD